ncbi:galactokinase [Thermoflexus sp.]|uniref:galactokinase n=1 Tax=Thermoflexus sp. TaxID=1969742 RepID=UPI0025DFA053|nr:galactokinase [Thermoflexus sp.]MDW8179905.1 galactokinase [Anaerolineae bacterium]MCS6963276.1 galactokinase [Thermoflexus sp.]MCS7350454.1 galactokinase [Thermoflexus sp.]MCX7689355.1 galactokinase [Thermoflexus sp.]MDW8183971.1 galactokinase [Anaerolineae bacterium]
MIHAEARAIHVFRERFGEPPSLRARAPGRVNLIGEHTDYNDGFVLPIAIDRAVWVAARPRPDRQAYLIAADFGEEAGFSLDGLRPGSLRGWAAYPAGVAWALERSGVHLPGLDAVISGDVPIASGLSSSAALEVAFAVAWLTLSGREMPRLELARLCQRAENEFVGVRCGIMDQMAALFGRRGHALLIDCRSLETRLIAIPEEVVVLVADSGVRRELAASGYNERRAQCEEAVRRLQRRYPGIRALRDVSPAQLEEARAELPELIYRRARHVVTENDRVLAAVAALERRDLLAFGEGLNASHESLRLDYEVSAPELDTLVEAARSVPGVYGARLTGAGFGGSILAVVQREAVQAASEAMARLYEARFGRRPALFAVAPDEGATVHLHAI